MKKIFVTMKGSGLLMFAVLLLAALFGVSGFDAAIYAETPAAATALSQPDSLYGDAALGGDGVVGEGYQTLDEALKESPNLVTRKIHDEVIKIAPYDYVTRSLLAKNFRLKKKTKDHKVAVYSAASKPIRTSVATAYTESAVDQAAIDFGADNKLFSVNQNVFFPGIPGYKDDGTTLSGKCLVCNVIDKASDKKPILKPLNGKTVSSVKTIPSLLKDTVALRGLRVGTETQIRTEPFNILPTDREYFIQKNIIEFGVSGWFDNATKEVKWSDRDRMEMAIAEKTRTSMPDFWLGVAGSDYLNTQYNQSKEELAYFSEGLWTQAGREFDFNGTIDVDAIIDFGRYVFDGNRSSNVKYFSMGSELSAEFQKVIFNNPTLLGETYKDKELNINFTAINFFGGKKILFSDDPSLDDVGMSNCGFLIDHRYAFEYHYGMESIPIDGKKLAQSDTMGQSIVEENCYILANHDAHCRVIF